MSLVAIKPLRLQPRDAATPHLVNVLRGNPTRCPYKSEASYWSGRRQAGTFTPDIAWSYRDPLPELQKICNIIAFSPDAVDAIRLDGRPVV